MKRVIKKIACLDDALRELVEINFPNGIRKKDLLSFPTPRGKRLYGIEVRNEDTVYLIHIPNALALNEPGHGLRIDYSLSSEEMSGED